MNSGKLMVRWGYQDNPEYAIDLLDSEVLKWMGIDPNDVDYDGIKISQYFPPSSYLKTDRNVMPSDQRIWGSGSAIIPDNNGRKGVACVVVRQDCSDPGNTHLNVDLWGWNAQGEAICDSDNRLVPKERGHFLDDSKPVVVIVSLDDTHLESKIPPIKKTPG